MYNDHDTTVTDDRSEILTWLSPLEPHLRHHDIQTNRIKDVGDWLLCTEEFRSWKSDDDRGEPHKATIFCSGNLGAGKTYISSLVIDTLCDEPGEAGEDIVVTCFYFNSAIQKEQSAASVFGALLKQVVGSFEQIPEEITDAFRRHKKFIGGRKLQLPEIVKMLGNFSSTRRTFFCLDAIDECAALDRSNILFSLKEIIRTSPTTRVFLTGRPHVGGEVKKHLAEGAAFVSISPLKCDIIRYIHKKLAQDPTLDEMDERLEAEIVKKIPETSAEIFLLVSLNLDAILRETSIHRRWERLQAMADGLGLEDAYGATLERIKAQGGQKYRLGMAALMWICHAERPLGAQELCQALVVEIGATDRNPDNVSSIRTVLSCCQGLVIVDKEGSTVRLIHHTLHEYLTNHRNLFQNPHSVIAETCLTYLDSQQVMALSGSCIHKAQYPPFLEYSSLYWGVHMKRQLTDCGKTLALKLFSRYEYHISVRPLLKRTLGQYLPRSAPGSYMFTGLHCASIFGLVEVLRALTIIGSVDINGVDETGATPLLWAAMGGHEAAVKLLLGQGGVDPDRPSGRGQAPIFWAASNGHEVAVKLLLERKEVDPGRPDSNGRTPISRATDNGHQPVLKLLLARGNINSERPYI